MHVSPNKSSGRFDFGKYLNYSLLQISPLEEQAWSIYYLAKKIITNTHFLTNHVSNSQWRKKKVDKPECLTQAHLTHLESCSEHETHSTLPSYLVGQVINYPSIVIISAIYHSEIYDWMHFYPKPYQSGWAVVSWKNLIGK